MGQSWGLVFAYTPRMLCCQSESSAVFSDWRQVFQLGDGLLTEGKTAKFCRVSLGLIVAPSEKMLMAFSLCKNSNLSFSSLLLNTFGTTSNNWDLLIPLYFLNFYNFFLIFGNDWVTKEGFLINFIYLFIYLFIYYLLIYCASGTQFPFCSFPPIPFPPFLYLPPPTSTPLFLFNKWQASHGYQQNMPYQVKVGLSSLLCVKAWQDNIYVIKSLGPWNPGTVRGGLPLMVWLWGWTRH